MGGVVATAYSSRYPVRGVVNVDQPLNVTPLPDSVKQAVSGRGFELFMTDLFGQLYGDPDPVIAENLSSQRTLRQEVVLGYWRPLLELTVDALNPWPNGILTMPSVRPYLSLHGFNPGLDYVEWLRGHIPGALVEMAPIVTH